MDYTSHRRPSAPGAPLYWLSAFSPGRHHEAFPQRGGPVFRPAYLPLFKTVAIAFQGGHHPARPSLQNTSPAVCQGPPTTRRAALQDRDRDRQYTATPRQPAPENAKTFNHGKGYV